MYEVITKARFKGKIYNTGEILPEEFNPDISWITQGIVKEKSYAIDKKAEKKKSYAKSYKGDKTDV